MTDDRGPQDLTLLIEQHQKEIWEWKQKESQWVKDKNQLEGNKKIIEELSRKMREAQGETSIVKAIGMNSPEVRALQDKIKELEGTLSGAMEINDDHQRYNGKLQSRLTEVEEDNKKLAKQIEHMNTRVWGGN